jgi:hypothetical protein
LVADYRGLIIRDKNGHQLSFQKKKKGEKKRRRRRREGAWLPWMDDQLVKKYKQAWWSGPI